MPGRAGAPDRGLPDSSKEADAVADLRALEEQKRFWNAAPDAALDRHPIHGIAAISFETGRWRQR